jgi:pimeloyl-ACP methyl ester carboxylesterase
MGQILDVNQMSHVVVFPGLSGPNHPDHEPVYDLLREHAEELGVNITVAVHPGQADNNGKIVGELSPDSAIEAAVALLKNLEMRRTPFFTIGISFGCQVSLAAAVMLSDSSFWKRAVLWGPIPHSNVWGAFGKGERDPALGKGTRFIPSTTALYFQHRAIEHLLPGVKVPVTIALGAQDKYVPREYLLWLQRVSESIPKPPFHTFVYVEGCGHNVKKTTDPNYPAYLDAVFSGCNAHAAR